METINKLQTVRKASKMKQKDIAAALGVSRGTLWHYEKGKRKLPFNMAVKLAKIYGVSVDELADDGG